MSKIKVKRNLSSDDFTFGSIQKKFIKEDMFIDLMRKLIKEGLFKISECDDYIEISIDVKEPA